MPYFAAVSRVGSICRPTSDTTSTPSISLMASRCFCPNAPAPARTTFISGSRVLEDQMAHGRVRRGHVIEPVYLFHAIVERAAHYQPHHELDAFGASLPQIVDALDLGQ